MFSDRTVLGVTIAVVLIACATFFIPDWVRQIGLLSMAIGSVALGLLVREPLAYLLVATAALFLLFAGPGWIITREALKARPAADAA